VTSKRRHRRKQLDAVVASGASGRPTPSSAQPETSVTLPSWPTLAFGPMVEIKERTWLIACVAIFLLALATRFYALELKPMHHDEGVNGYFLTSLVRQGIYRYDPTNYHGPTLYYLALPGVKVFGLGTFALRFLTALFGAGTIWLILSLRRNIGALAALTGAALIAVSPGAIYYSRYFIHETLFVFFTLGIVVATLRFYETSRTVYALLAAASAAMLFATKETAFVSVGTLVLAWLVAWRWTTSGFNLDKHARSIFGFQSRRTLRDKGRMNQVKNETAHPKALISLLGGRDRLVMLAIYAVGLFILLNILFYSSFFTNWPGVSGALQAMKVWANTGTSEFHGKPFDTYLKWLVQEEAPILLLATAGALVALLGREVHRFAVFAGAWAFGMLAAYSLIPYKTPWLALSFVVPMAIIGGYAVQRLSGLSLGVWKAPGPAFAMTGLALAVLGYQSLVLNFREYDNDQYPYVYTHSNREMLTLVSEVERLGALAGTTEIGVNVASPEYWPLPWYFRDNPRVGFAGTIAQTYDPNDVPLVIARASADPKEDQIQQLSPILAVNYKQVGVYTLRPGVRLALFARNDLAAR
jgi:uncharacterized protein (TIGR03663 family)